MPPSLKDSTGASVSKLKSISAAELQIEGLKTHLIPPCVLYSNLQHTKVAKCVQLII